MCAHIQERADTLSHNTRVDFTCTCRHLYLHRHTHTHNGPAHKQMHRDTYVSTYEPTEIYPWIYSNTGAQFSEYMRTALPIPGYAHTEICLHKHAQTCTHVPMGVITRIREQRKLQTSSAYTCVPTDTGSSRRTPPLHILTVHAHACTHLYVSAPESPAHQQAGSPVGLGSVPSPQMASPRGNQCC